MCTATWVSARAKTSTIFAPISSRPAGPPARRGTVLPRGPGILGPGLTTERLQHRLDGGSASSGVRLPRKHARAAERSPSLRVPVVEPVLTGVGPRGRTTFQARHAAIIRRSSREAPHQGSLRQDRDRLRAQLRRAASSSTRRSPVPTTWRCPRPPRAAAISG